MRARLLAATAALLLLTAACGGEPSPEPAPYKSPSTPAPTSSGADAAPTLPKLARSGSYDGAGAFVSYYFDMFAYASNTGDLDQLRALGADNCNSCSRIAKTIAATYEAGGSSSGVDYSVDVRKVEKVKRFVQVSVVVKSGPQTNVPSAGASPNTDQPFSLNAEFRLTRTADGWLVDEWLRS